MNLESKIKGALYGFAIGDAMGATTEFESARQIEAKYGKVTDIIGGGWLNLKPGDVTDDTQMMLCVCDAIEYGFGEKREWDVVKREAMLDKCCQNFAKWFLSNPPDIGGCCRRVISQCLTQSYYEYWLDIADDPQSLGNGSLMRTLPIILAGLPKDLAILQGRLTHNNKMCDSAIAIYYENMFKIIHGNGQVRNFADKLVSPEGHVANTLHNAMYWTQNTKSLEEAIIGAVNHGGDADTIAAITGSLVGAMYGFEAIPDRWVEQLDPKVKEDLEKYAKLFENLTKKYVHI